jgi:hypothetical protein
LSIAKKTLKKETARKSGEKEKPPNKYQARER